MRFDSFQFGLAVLTPCTEKGVEKHVELDNLSANDVESKVAQLLGS